MFRYLVIAIPILCLTPFAVYLAGKIVWTAIRTKAVIVGGLAYNFTNNSAFVSFVIAVWLLLAGAMLLASAALLSELPSVFNQSF